MSKAGLGQQDPSTTRMVVEKRRSERTPMVVRVDYSTVDAFFSEFTANINEGGMFVESEAPPPVGTSVLLAFRLPGSAQPIQVEGRVVWTHRERSTDSPGMGIEFENLDDASRARINALVRELRADLPRNAKASAQTPRRS